MKLTKKGNSYYDSLGKVLSSKDRKETLQMLKNSLDFNVLNQVSDKIIKIINPLSFFIHGKALPFKLEDLGKSDVIYKPKSIENEVKWVMLSIKKFSAKLSLFLILKVDFEKFFLLGNYIKAENTLETIFKETGYSLWYIEAKFLLLEYQNKSEEQKIFLSEINEVNKEGLVGTLAHFLAQRTERNLSAYKYDSDISNLFRKNKNKEKEDNLGKERYRFKLNYFENYELEDYSFIITIENKNSIIDRYLNLINVLKSMFLIEEYQKFVYLKAIYIYRKTDDRSLLPLLFGFNSKFKDTNYFDLNYIKILNLYYSGLYQETINECSKYLLKNTKHFDLLVIYSKCHINLKKKFTDITYNEGSLINQLGFKVYSLICNLGNRKDLLYNLYQINKNLISFDIATGLDYFLKNEQNFLINKKLKLLSNYLFDPYFSLFFNNDKKADEYLENGSKILLNSISIEHWRGLINNEILKGDLISKEISLIDGAKILFKKENFEDSIIQWEIIIKLFNDNAPIVQISLKYWFESLIQLELYNEAIELFVNYFLIDSNSTNKIKAIDLLTTMRRLRYKGIKRSIDLPIFVSINSNDDLEKSFILEQYCKIFQKKRPSELFENLINDNKKNELFYNVVCNSETLKHSIYINTTIDRLTERQKIINHLIETNTLKSKIYQEELILISNELIIYEGTQKLDESKIYANDQAIINNELNDIEGLFKRYKTIYSLSQKDRKILVITNDSYALYKFDDKEKYKETEVKYSDSALIEVFTELFDLIIDKYLYSKYGIVAYLSTRIRHGVLLGEIRPEFEKKNLILSRIGNSTKYEYSKYWTGPFFNLNEEQKRKLNEILSEFSLRIDTIIENIIKEKIQIRKDGKNLEGLFNYEFDRLELYSYANQLATETNAKVFCQKVIDLIWDRTDVNLEVIRSYFDNEIKTIFSDQSNQLESELCEYFSNNQLSRIFTNITDCSTIIENKLNKISSWFRRSGSSISDFDIEKVFNIVWANTERCYTKIPAECKISLNVNPIIKSNYYIHFTDLFRIFLDNMFKYGGYESGKKKFEFSCTQDADFLVCTFSNIKNQEDEDLPMETINSELIIDNKKLISESKSGISKAVKIVKYDLDNENNFIKIDTENKEKFVITAAIEINNLIQNEENINC